MSIIQKPLKLKFGKYDSKIKVSWDFLENICTSQFEGA